MNDVKIYDPQEPVSVTMTREQWDTVRRWITYGVDQNKNSAYWWANCCSNKDMGAETAASYERAVTKLEGLIKIIDTCLGVP
ncbi:MAG: hypothetical protein ACI3V4_02560 [Faecousia sp.]